MISAASGGQNRPQDIQVSLTAIPQGQAAGPQPSPALTPLPVIAVPGIKSCEHALENGYLHITITKADDTRVEKYFKITAGITNPVLAKKIMDAYQRSGALKEIAGKIIMNEAANATSVTSPSKQMKLKLTLREGHFVVNRVSKETGEEDPAIKPETVQLGTLSGNSSQTEKSLSSTFEKAREQLRIKHQLANQLTEKGFSPATVKATIAKIFEDAGLSDLLQSPNNEAHFGALSDLRNNSGLIRKVDGIKQLPTNEKSEKLCRQFILGFLLPDHRDSETRHQEELNPVKSFFERTAAYQARKEEAERIKKFVREQVKLTLIDAGVREVELPEKILNDGLQLACHVSELNLTNEKIDKLEKLVVAGQGKPGFLTKKELLLLATLQRIITMAKKDL